MTWSIWVIAGLALLIAELLTGTLFFGPVSVGALVTALAAGLGLERLELQLVVFSLGSTVLVLVSRKFLRPLIVRTSDNVQTNVDALAGKVAVISEPIDATHVLGRATLDGMDWSVRSHDGRAIPAGVRVVVVSVDGAKLIVKPEGEA